MKTAELRKQIYLTCKSLCYLKDDDNVKLLRDDTANKLFNRPESELNDSERSRLLHYLRNRQPDRAYCSRKQSNAVRNLAFEFAIMYYDYDGIKVTNKLGQLMQSEDVKLMIQEQYKQNGYTGLTSKVKIILFEECANPKCKELLAATGLRPNVGNPHVFYYDQMTYEEADYLIRRFTKLNAKAQMIKPIGVTNQISNN